MSRIITAFTIVAIVIWTLLSLGTWAVISFGGDLLHAQLDWLFFGSPDAVPVASSVVRVLQGLGVGILVLIWALGSAMLGLIGFVLRRIVRSMEASLADDPAWNEARMQPGEMKDITPPRHDPAQRSLPRDHRRGA